MTSFLASLAGPACTPLLRATFSNFVKMRRTGGQESGGRGCSCGYQAAQDCQASQHGWQRLLQLRAPEV